MLKTVDFVNKGDKENEKEEVEEMEEGLLACISLSDSKTRHLSGRALE